MKIALTGASGIAGEALLRGLAGHEITVLGRNPVPGHPHLAWHLGAPTPDLGRFDALIHAAFAHAPGRYRGGEGDDPQGFRAANLDGTCRLFEDCARAGVGRVIFLSSRAVYDGLGPDTTLTEDRPPCPQSLYGQIKAEAERHLFSLPLQGIALRCTGLYGPGKANKWAPLFTDYLAGHPIEPRRGTELHVDDLASAVSLLLASDESGPVHASDMMLDRHDLLAAVRHLTGCPHDLPARSARAVNPLISDRLSALGWQPGGLDLLQATLPALLPSDFSSPEIPRG